MKAIQIRTSRLTNNSLAIATQQKSLGQIPSEEIIDGRYAVRLARTPQEKEAALRLRYEVFNLELGEGLESSYITGRDEDRFDAICDHLIVQEQTTGKVVGTYRLQTLEMARNISEFYCAGEFRLEDLPHSLLTESLEIGRACVALEHRNTKVLFLLWKGLSSYAVERGKRFLFGCCSLTSQNAAEGWQAARLIERNGDFHRELRISPRDGFECEKDSCIGNGEVELAQLPKLFNTYLRFGAKVCSEPAIDRDFKTIDFLVIFDFEMLEGKHRKLFLG